MRAAQCVGADDTDAIGVHIPQALPKTLKTRERARSDLAIEPAIGIETRSEAHVLAQAINDNELSVAIASHDQMKTIGT